MKKFYIKENSLIARIAAWKLGSDKVAIVIGTTVHLHNTTRKEFLGNRNWLRHELKHIEQFKRHGWLTFVWLYLVESARNGYHNNCYEIEARMSENDTMIEKAYQVYEK